MMPIFDFSLEEAAAFFLVVTFVLLTLLAGLRVAFRHVRAGDLPVNLLDEHRIAIEKGGEYLVLETKTVAGSKHAVRVEPRQAAVISDQLLRAAAKAAAQRTQTEPEVST